MNSVLSVISAVLFALIILVWLGLNVKPKALAAVPKTDEPLETIPLPQGLPQPVERFFRTLYGDEVPVVKGAIISGRATMRLMGIPFPAVFRFTHQPGQGYHHYMEASFFGFAFAKVNEYFVGRETRLELPFGVVENEPKINQAANLGLWGETIWYPCGFLTDPRVRWLPLDEHSAVLLVPFGEQEDAFLVQFHPETGLAVTFSAMRYREARNLTKILWVSGAIAWKKLDGQMTMVRGGIRWVDQSKPWAVFDVEQVIVNQTVDEEKLRAPGA